MSSDFGVFIFFKFILFRSLSARSWPGGRERCHLVAGEYLRTPPSPSRRPSTIHWNCSSHARGKAKGFFGFSHNIPLKHRDSASQATDNVWTFSPSRRPKCPRTAAAMSTTSMVTHRKCTTPLSSTRHPSTRLSCPCGWVRDDQLKKMIFQVHETSSPLQRSTWPIEWIRMSISSWRGCSPPLAICFKCKMTISIVMDTHRW